MFSRLPASGFLLPVLLVLATSQAAFSQKYTTSESTAPKARAAYLDGRTYLQQGDAPRALRAFEKAIGEDSVFIEAHLLWAETHFDNDHWDEAAAGYEKVLRLNPGFLGGMRVGVEVDGNSVVASLEATSADVREWIQRNEPVLRQALADQGLHLERLVIIDDDSRPASDDERGTGEQSQQQQREPSKRSRRPETEGTFEIEL